MTGKQNGPSPDRRWSHISRLLDKKMIVVIALVTAIVVVAVAGSGPFVSLALVILGGVLSTIVGNIFGPGSKPAAAIGDRRKPKTHEELEQFMLEVRRLEETTKKARGLLGAGGEPSNADSDPEKPPQSLS